MNLPNKLTVMRVILIPFFVAALLYDNGSSQTMRVVANVIFIVASLTDLFDGKIARKYNLVTNFGKFMDPLADKLLVCSALICLIQLGQLPAWIVIIIISREFIISGFRLVAADNGIVIAASYWGKFKTTFQMIAVILMIFNIPALKTVTFIMLAAAVVLTIVSLVDYVAKNVGAYKGRHVKHDSRTDQCGNRDLNGKHFKQQCQISGRKMCLIGTGYVLSGNSGR